MKARIVISNQHENKCTPAVARGFGPSHGFPVQAGMLFCLLLLGAPQVQVQAGPVTYSIWNDATIPAIAATPIDSSSVELGLKFKSAVNGNITGIRFYKGPGNTGPHVGSLWNSDGTLVVSVSFDNETASGWQQQALPSPVPISANTTYIVSYHAPQGGYAVDLDYFANSGVNHYALRALKDGDDGQNGLYKYALDSQGWFPNSSFRSGNYWVDVVFEEKNLPETPSIWNNDTIPALVDANDTSAVEVGLKFRSIVAGNITAIRFYKALGNTGTHVGNLWALDGTLLASVTFANETPSGWQQQALDKPVAISADTTYVVSYYAPVGHYAADSEYFATWGVCSNPLRALANGEDGPNGLYAYSASSTFPNQTYQANNYWVDVVIQPTVDNNTVPATPSTPALAAVSDTGTLGDNITSVTTPTLTGTAEANSLIILYSDGIKVGSQQLSGGATSFSIATVTLAEGPHIITATATDAAGNVSSASGALSVTIDTTAPTIQLPTDVILVGADWKTDPGNTGTATASDDNGVFSVDFSDSVSGVCPKVVKRTWTATDVAGNPASGVQTITCLPPSLVTGGSGCAFDLDPSSTAQDFRLVFIQDPQNWPSYKLAASNPGQFFYNVFYVGNPGAQVTFNITLPYPFVTQGANPIHACDWVTVTGMSGQPCLAPGNAFFVSSQQVKLADYGTLPAASTAIPVSLTVPPSGVVYLAIHLDYGLKGTSGYMTDINADAVDASTGTKMLIPNNGNYIFSVDGAQASIVSIQNDNSFKKIPGVAGLVLNSVGDGVLGAVVTLQNATHRSLVSDIADENGFYMLDYKQTGKAATFYVSVVPPSIYSTPIPQPIQLKANAFVRLDFLVTGP